MKRQINLHNRKIEYILKTSGRSRRMRLAVYADKGIVVTAPQNTGEGFIEDFIMKNSRWVIGKLDYFKQFKSQFLLKVKRRNLTKHKEDALAIVKNRLEYFNKDYQFIFNKICIRNQH